jgi:hypothetical protein
LHLASQLKHFLSYFGGISKMSLDILSVWIIATSKEEQKKQKVKV